MPRGPISVSVGIILRAVLRMWMVRPVRPVLLLR